MSVSTPTLTTPPEISPDCAPPIAAQLITIASASKGFGNVISRSSARRLVGRHTFACDSACARRLAHIKFRDGTIG